jgi:beta-N-acetylhexosaminidase
LQPFKGLAHQLDAMMIAHVVYSGIERLPAGYSPTWLREYLRQRIGFRGVIFSDDLGMHAAKSLGNIGARTRAAFNAGCDAALVCMPDDVLALLPMWSEDDDFANAGLSLGTLYGTPPDQHMTDTAELLHWREQLERLC